MQRSQKALLQRRAALEKGVEGRNLIYKVSLSMMLLVWVVVFLLNSLISQGNGYRDGLGTVVGESSWHENKHGSTKTPDSRDDLAHLDAESNYNDQKSHILVGEAAGPRTDVLDGEDSILKSSTIKKEQMGEEISDLGVKAEKETPVKSDRLSRVASPGLDEFKSKAISAKEKHLSGQTGAVIHRVEPGGKEYNYASSTKGAKVLAFNKEVKGASNILDRDNDKYLRNPCSAEEKYVVIELSEETLVDSIEIANFEHYSSNLKDFELLSSLIYPTDNWVMLGNFTAANVKHAQRFSLPEPKWSRYLKLNLLNHYGFEFYCTLSVVEVYGLDAVERMLEDFFSVENNRLEPEEQNTEETVLQEATEEGDLYRELFTQIDNKAMHDSTKQKREVPKNTVPDPVGESKPPQVGRMPGDTVLKILMQKVQSLDMNFSILEQYLEELNSRYGHIFKEFDDDIADKDLLLKKIKLAIKNLENNEDILASDIKALLSWKSLVSSQVNQLVEDNTNLRSEVEKIHNYQVHMENRSLSVIFMAFVFGCLAAAKLFIGLVLTVCRIDSSEKFCSTNPCWLLLLLSSSIIAFILVV